MSALFGRQVGTLLLELAARRRLDVHQRCQVVFPVAVGVFQEILVSNLLWLCVVCGYATRALTARCAIVACILQELVHCCVLVSFTWAYVKG